MEYYQGKGGNKPGDSGVQAPDKETLKKKYLPLVVQQLKKGFLPQSIKPKLMKLGFTDPEADELLNQAIAQAGPALGPQAAAVQAQAPTPQAVTVQSSPPEAPKPAASIAAPNPEAQKGAEVYKETREKLLAAGFSPFETEKMARAKAQEAQLSAKREKLLAAGFSAEESEKMLKTSPISTSYTTPAAATGQVILPIYGGESRMNYAGVAERFVAYIIDNIIISIAWGAIWFFLIIIPGGAMVAQEQGPSAGLIIFWILAVILMILVPWVYFTIMESSERMATFGKSFLGLAVVDVNGDRLSLGRALLRTFAKGLSFGIFIGPFFAFFNPQKQALHDLIAGTIVVKNR